MINIYDSENMNRVLAGSGDAALKAILVNRLYLLQEFLEIYDFGDILTIHIVEINDSIEDIDLALNIPVLENLVDGARYPEPDWEQSWEFCIKRDGYFEITYALSDSGQGLVLIVPDRDGVEPQLLELCRAYATT